MVTRPVDANQERVVVCVEDDESLAQLLALMLRRVPLVRVVLTGSRQEALRAIAGTRCDVVITDLNLPDASGVGWITELVTLPALLEVPVIVMSADKTPQTIEAVLGTGVTEYLTKPVARERLVSVVSDLIDAAAVEDASSASIATDETPPPTLMDRCLAESGRDVEELRDAVTRRDVERIEWFSHRLKGRAMMYDMVEVTEAVEQLEAAVRADQMEIADGLVHRIDEALERCRDQDAP